MEIDKRIYEPRLTLREASDYAETSLQNIYYHVNKNNIKSFVSYGLRYIALSEIAAFLAKNKNNCK